MAFFDENVSDDLKKRMFLNIKNKEFSDEIEGQIPERYEVSRTKYMDFLLHKGISSESMIFFERFQIDFKFLDKDSSEWNFDKND